MLQSTQIAKHICYLARNTLHNVSIQCIDTTTIYYVRLSRTSDVIV